MAEKEEEGTISASSASQRGAKEERWFPYPSWSHFRYSRLQFYPMCVELGHFRPCGVGCGVQLKRNLQKWYSNKQACKMKYVCFWVKDALPFQSHLIKPSSLSELDFAESFILNTIAQVLSKKMSYLRLTVSVPHENYEIHPKTYFFMSFITEQIFRRLGGIWKACLKGVSRVCLKVRLISLSMSS